MNNRAFTLVETLAVIILLGVIMSIAIPSINNAMDSANKRRIKEDAEMFIILAKEYVETHKDFKEGSISICNDATSDECIDPNKLSDVYTSGTVIISNYEAQLENEKYIANGKSGEINVNKK